MTPVEMLGYVEFPAITRAPYSLSLGPYGFLWLELQPSLTAASALSSDGDQAFYVESERDWQSVLSGDGVRRLEEMLRGYIQRQRWFGGKSRSIVRTQITDSMLFDDNHAALLWVKIEYVEGEPDSWLVSLAMSFGEAATGLRESAPQQMVASVGSATLAGVLHEGMLRASVPAALLEMIDGGKELRTRNGVLVGMPSSVLTTLRGPRPCRRA